MYGHTSVSYKVIKKLKRRNSNNLKISRETGRSSQELPNVKSIKRNRQFQVTKLPLNFYGVSISLTNVNNISLFHKNPSGTFRKNDSKVFNDP